jgi:hypothetical protein
MSIRFESLPHHRDTADAELHRESTCALLW